MESHGLTAKQILQHAREYVRMDNHREALDKLVLMDHPSVEATRQQTAEACSLRISCYDALSDRQDRAIDRRSRQPNPDPSVLDEMQKQAEHYRSELEKARTAYRDLRQGQD
ncbi:MAG: hypothetical protein ACYTG0_00215 [Planctomycetota bacterium]|jgi:uncharacterized protein (DUF3084 family)